ncbi:MAG: coproporphyrinogen III oxidase family protein [Spirochaetaceae bacterium]|jgi:coproporphyrinogen III oxidase-like Fe-S oxidoreductase|nr:coproporphyrinogen III oxidase family protein [Spirochaetaceae bacterium]
MLFEYALAYVSRHFMNRYLKVDNNFTPDTEPSPPDRSLMLYIHIPFCEELCPYCSFYKVPFKKSLAELYYDSLFKEIRLWFDKGYKFDSVYIGGGTPTVLPEKLASLVLYLKSLWDIKDISVETNPNHLIPKYMDPVKKAGINRLSVGVQTFDDSLLKKLKRYDKYGSGQEIADKLKALQGTFDTLNIDMMFNFPEQTEKMLDYDLSVLEKLKGDQVTYYPLMPSRSVKAEIRSLYGEVDYKKEKRFYNKIVQSLGKDYSRASAWCFSQKGGMIDEYIVDYNEYVGCGAGAFSFLNGEIRANLFSIDKYIEKIEKGESSIITGRSYSIAEQIRYDFLMGFFSGSLNLNILKERYGKHSHFYLILQFIFMKVAGGIKKSGSDYKLTEKGMYYLVILMREFFTGVNNVRQHCNILEVE